MIRNQFLRDMVLLNIAFDGELCMDFISQKMNIVTFRKKIGGLVYNLRVERTVTEVYFVTLDRIQLGIQDSMKVLKKFTVLPDDYDEVMISNLISNTMEYK